MKDEMSLFQGVASSYQSMPLSILHQLKSVLDIEIQERLALFGVEYDGENGDKGKRLWETGEVRKVLEVEITLLKDLGE